MVELVWDLAWALVNTLDSQDPPAASLRATAVTVTTPAPAPALATTISTPALPTIRLSPELSGSEVPGRATTGPVWSSPGVTWRRWDRWDRWQAGCTRTSNLEEVVVEVEVEDTRACHFVEAAVPAWSTPATPS